LAYRGEALSRLYMMSPNWRVESPYDPPEHPDVRVEVRREDPTRPPKIIDHLDSMWVLAK